MNKGKKDEFKKLMPESYYSLDSSMSLDKIVRAKKTGNFLVAKVLNLNFSKKCLRVDLGNSFNGEIPLDEFSIYPVIRTNNSISPWVYSFFGKTICVCVRKISDDNTIILSRKANMLKSFNLIEQFKGNVVSCLITSIVDYGLFVDVGHGINSLIHNRKLSLTQINNPKDIGFTVGQSIDAEIISTNSEKYRVSLNHKNLFDNVSKYLTPGDIIEVISLNPVNEDEDGYYAFFNPSTTAIINPIKGIKIPYGSKVKARVKKFKPNHPDKLQLGFISFTV